MTTTEKSRAVLEMVCEGNVVNDLGLLEQEYSDLNQEHIVAPYTIGLHHHTHDTASKYDRALSVPALDASNATGPLCDASLHRSDLIVDNNIHIHIQGGSDINWTPEIDRAIAIYMTGSTIRYNLNPSVLPDILSRFSAFEILRRWQDLDPINVLPPNFGGSWTEDSYTDTDSTGSSYAESHPWAFIANNFLNGVADVVDSAPYFWTVTIFKIYKARKDPIARALVLNDILTRHVSLIRSLANKQLPEGHILDTAKLLDDVADSLADLTDDEVSEFARTVPNGDIVDYDEQAGADFFEHFNTFANAYAAVTAIYKYMSDRNVIYPLIKLLVGGSLFAFGSHIGDSEVFTSENIKAATNTIFGFFRTGTVGAFMQVFDSISKLFRTWIDSDGAMSLTQHLDRTNKAEQYYQIGVRLLKLQSNYAIELVTVQRAYLSEVNDFIGYCVDHLGAGTHVKNPWQAAFSIIPDRSRITWFQTTWRQLDAFYTIEISRSMRMQPCVFFLESGSSIGKTTLQKILNQMLLTEHLDVPVEQVDTFTYPWPSDEPSFANGAKNSMITVIFDDIGALRHDITKSTGGDPFIKRLLGLLNMFPYGPDQASLELKGKIFLAPEVVILSTNNPKLGLHLTYNEPGAVWRRLGAIIHVIVAPDFVTDTATLDDKKLNDWCKANPGAVPDAWRFRIENFKADNRDYNQNGKGIKVVSTYHPLETDPMMDTPTFLKWASEKFAAHKAIHTSILDTLNVPFNFGPILRPDEEVIVSEPKLYESQSGADAWFMAKSHFQPPAPSWAQNFTSTIVGATNIDHYFYWFLAVFASLWSFILFYFYLPTLSRSLYYRAANWYNGLLLVRIIHGVNTGRELVVSCHDRKRRALEWLDNNKRTIALLTTVVSVGAVAAYVFRSRKDNHHDSQVGDEHKSPRKGFTVTTTSNDRVSRWETMGTRVDQASMYGLSQQSLSASGSNVVSITANNMVDITFSSSISSYKCAGIMVAGRRLILNRHSLPQYCKQRSTNPKWSEYTMTVHGAGYNNHNLGSKDIVVSHDHINGNYLPLRDLAGIMLPTNCRPYRDISDFFPKAPNALWTKDFVYTRSVMPPGTKMALGRKTPMGVDVSPYGLVVPGDQTRAEHVMVSLGKSRKITLDVADDIGPPVMCFQLKTPDVVTLAGHCGSPYFLYERMDNIGAIAGIHLGQMIDERSTKVVIPIYCSDIVALFSDIEAPPESEAGPIMSEAETQSGVLSHSFATCNYELQQGDIKFDITLHNSPKLSSDTYWAQNTIEYMKDKMGVEVNVNSFAVVGYDTGGGNLSSDYQKSPMYEPIYNMDPTGLPDNMRSDKHVNNLTRSKRNHDAAAGIAAIMTHENYNPVLADEFMNAAEAYFESIVALDQKGDGCIFKHVHPVDVDVAINGSHFSNDGITTTNHKGMEAMAMKTSPGHPWVMMFPDDVQEGIQRVGKYPWFKCAYEPDGRRHYTMGPQLSDSYQELLSLFKKDHKTKVKFVTACKDEVKKDKKPTRLIMVGPQCLTIVCRQFLMTICRVMQLNPFVFGAVVGLDATCVQWDQVHNFICGTQSKRYAFDGDYKDFDKSLFQEVTDGVKWIILSICECSGNFDDEQMFVVESILCCLLSPVVDVFGVIYWFRSFNTSGNSLTTQINCIANMLFVWVAWTRRMKKDMGSAYDERLSRDMFNRLVHVVTYGDDHMVGVTYPDILNCRIMEEELSQLITYTDAHKNTGADIAEFTSHDELIFLGRSMVIDESGSCKPPLEFKRLAKTCLFFRKRAGIQYEHMIPDLFQGILLEVHFHGKDVYNVFYERILEIMCEHYSMNRGDLEASFFMNASGQLLTYDYFRQWWLEKKDKGYLHDPKYEMVVHPDPEKDRELHDRYLALKALGATDTNVA